MTQKIISGFFSAFIIGWAILNILLILGTSHSYESIDKRYLLVAILSLVIFPLTALSLYRFKKTVQPRSFETLTLVTLLIITASILGYYIVEFWTGEYATERNFYNYLPVLAILVDFWLLYVLVIKKRFTDSN